MRIVCIEDEPADAELMERYATLKQHEFVIATNLEEGYAALGVTTHLILVDIILNRARVGYQLVKNLRSQGYTTPIVAVTGLALPNDIQQCYEAGFSDVLTKPYNIQQLVELFNKYDA